MASEAAHLLANYLHHLCSAARVDNLPDRTLIERFASQRDEDAFAALVRRHGPMVLRVCQRVLQDAHAAEDAFQATFLVLSRKAASLRCADTVGCFLHGVAFRVAQNARKQNARRQKHESQNVVENRIGDPLAEVTVREAQAILDQELGRLPEKYRAPLVLCCLEGKTRDEAARQLGWSSKLVKSRLEQGRERLHQRLTRRGLTLSAVLMATLLAEQSAPVVLSAAMIHAAVQAGRSSNGVSASVAILAQSALGSTAIGKAKATIVGLLLLTGVVAAGVGRFAPPQPSAQNDETPAAAKVKVPEPAKGENSQPALTDRYGDPLPPRALARLGTVRFRPGEPIAHIAFSSDGKLVATATQNMEVNANLISVSLWDRTTGKRLRQISVGKKPPFALAFAPNGEILATQDERGEIHLWDVRAGKELRRIAAGGIVFETGRGPGGQIRGIGFAFSPDGKTLAARGPDKAIHLWEAATGKERRRFKADPEDFSPLVFSGDGKLLATSAEKMVRLWDVETGKERTRLKGHEDSARTSAFSADGKTFTVLSRTPGELWQVTAYVWDVATAELLHKWNLPPNPVFTCCLSPDGAKALAGGGGYDMRLFDLANGKEIRRLSKPSDTFFAAVFAPDSKTIAAAGQNRALLLWDTASEAPKSVFVGHQGVVHSLALSPDDKLLASVASDDGIKLWDLAAARPLSGFHSPKDHFTSVAISPDGQWLAAATQWRKGVRLLKTRTGEEVRRFMGCENGENVLAFSPDGKILAGGSTDNVERPRDKSIRLWEAATGKLLHQMRLPLPARPDGGILCLAFSPDGRLLASGGSGENGYIWNVVTGEMYCRLPGHEYWVSSLCFSPEGQTLAATDWERKTKAIRLWEVRTGKERGQLIGHTDRVSSLAFSPDGRLASAGDDKTIHIWNPDTGEEMGCFRGHESVVGPLTFSSDGQRLISGGWDTTILMWDMKTIPQPRHTKAVELSLKELEARWADLADTDASKAFRSIRTLIRARQQAVSFFMDHLRPIPPEAAEKIAAWIAELDNERFETRSKAEAELEKLEEQAEPALRRALQNGPASPEARRRLEALLHRLEGPTTSTETLRQLRAVEVLEHIGSPQARQVLQTLAAGAPEARLTREAKAALERLMQRSSVAP